MRSQNCKNKDYTLFSPFHTFSSGKTYLSPLDKFSSENYTSIHSDFRKTTPLSGWKGKK